MCGFSIRSSMPVHPGAFCPFGKRARRPISQKLARKRPARAAPATAAMRQWLSPLD